MVFQLAIVEKSARRYGRLVPTFGAYLAFGLVPWLIRRTVTMLYWCLLIPIDYLFAISRLGGAL
jgi:hypothetical protein